MYIQFIFVIIIITSTLITAACYMPAIPIKINILQRKTITFLWLYAVIKYVHKVGDMQKV